MILEQWIVIGADPFWPVPPGSSVIEYTAECRSINISSMDCEPDNPAAVLIHDHHHPVAVQQPGRRADRFASEEVNAPQAILCVTEGCEPRRPTVTGIWFVVNRQNMTNGVFVQVQSERQIDLLRYSRAAVARIELFHFYDRFDDFFGWSLWSRSPATTR